MKADERKGLLKLAAIGLASLWLLDVAVVEPFISRWNEQGDRIDALHKKVDRGEQLVAREPSTRARWADMVHANLPADNSVAEGQAYTAISRWVAESGISLNSQGFSAWQTHDEGYETIECRVTATGDQVSLAKFIYSLETDPIPVNLEECELTTRDTRGAQLSLTARFTFMRLASLAANGKGAP